ncbi:hypothetical protein ACI77N_13145 [Pseudomonas sp. S191]|uniref:hypothetical protein n=1 Tax=Pseudomonas sp. S191 TaxID=579575 RepID=UPI00387B70DA
MEAAQLTATALGWGDILKIVLASGVVAAAIGWLKDWVFKSRDQRKEAKFAAIEIVGKLDQYARQSSRSVYHYRDITAQLDPHVHFQNWPSCTYPDLEVSRDALKSIDTDLASEVAWFATTQAHADEYLYYIYDQSADPFEDPDARASVVGFMGYEAYELACKLREHYGLMAYATRWELAGDFQDLHRDWKKIKKDIADRLRNQQAS